MSRWLRLVVLAIVALCLAGSIDASPTFAYDVPVASRAAVREFGAVGATTALRAATDGSVSRPVVAQGTSTTPAVPSVATEAGAGLNAEGGVGAAEYGPQMPGGPKSTPNFKPPTNPAQMPPGEIPPGWRIREMPPTAQYPEGYWKLEKPMPNGGWQPIDPSTMKPGGRPETHVPFPPGG